MNSSIDYIIHLGDNALILGQRNAEWCGHGPVLEQDIAITNISLDLIGQARYFYQLAATLKNDGATEDTFAYRRDVRSFTNILLTEQPRGDWAYTILRQLFFSAYQYLLYSSLQQSRHEQLAAIAGKSLKEVSYHLRWSSEWVIRLGDGTEESRRRILTALDSLWPFTGEWFVPAVYETPEASGIATLPDRTAWLEMIKPVFEEANIAVPADGWMQSGGKAGKHSEHLGYILAELQFLQRAYPDAQW